jgi:positive regulator of sigma E activity
MGAVGALRHSGLARKGLLALVVLAYLVYVAGLLLEVGVDGLLSEFPYLRITVATAALVVAGLFISSFFVTEEEAAEDEPEAEEAADA